MFMNVHKILSSLYENCKTSYLTFQLVYFYLFIVSLMLTITEQMLFTTKNNNKMVININTLVKKPIEHKKFQIKKQKIKYP